MPYTLERVGNRWKVKARPEAGANPHGGNMMQMPAMPEQSSGGVSMPPGHPQIGKGAPSGTNK